MMWHYVIFFIGMLLVTHPHLVGLGLAKIIGCRLDMLTLHFELDHKEAVWYKLNFREVTYFTRLITGCKMWCPLKNSILSYFDIAPCLKEKGQGCVGWLLYGRGIIKRWIEEVLSWNYHISSLIELNFIAVNYGKL